MGTNRRVGDRKKTNLGRPLKSGCSPYQVKRWRLDETNITYLESKRSACKSVAGNRNDDVHAHLRETIPCPAELHSYSQKLHYDVSSLQRKLGRGDVLNALADNILNLVTYNAFRGLFANKKMLSQLVKHIIPHQNTAEQIDIMDRFPDPAIILPSKPNIPPCLMPTRLQMQVPHATWIDLIPFPLMRDNLIMGQDQFNHSELIADVIGNLLAHVVFEDNKFHPKSQLSLKIVNRAKYREDSDDRRGLILWGEPYQPGSWEVTPGFLENWGWTVLGCAELMEATNKWRVLRGEEPISNNA